MAQWISWIDDSGDAGKTTVAGVVSNGPTHGIGISSDLNIAGLSTFSGAVRFTGDIRIDGKLKDGDNAFGSSGQVLSSDGTDLAWVNAGSLSAGAASQVAINDDSNTNSERFITFVDSSSGNNSIKTDPQFKYNPSTNTITTTNITGNVTGDLTGDVTGDVTGDISGNAGSATVLQTARNIGGVSFNGSANINLPGVNATGNQNTSGNALTATTLAANRDFSITGEITANAISFNGSGNVTLSATIDDNTVDEANLKISNSGTNGQFLCKRSGNTGGLTWEDVTIPSANTLSGSTLASSVTASSLTSLGTLSSLSVTGTATINGSLVIDTVNINDNVVQSNTSDSLVVRGKGTGGAAHLKLDDHVTVIGNMEFDAGIKDKDGNLGSAGQVLASTGSQVDWANYVKSDASDSITSGVLTMSSSSQYPLQITGSNDGKIVLKGSSNPYVRFQEGSTDRAYMEWNSSSNAVIICNQEEGNDYLKISGGTNGLLWQYDFGGERKVWHEGNDGSGSGLDADTVDGLHKFDCAFPSGTRMMFQQTSAPTGWTKDTTDVNQRALRVVSGSVGSGGNTDFTDAFRNWTTNNHTLTTAQIPSHRHWVSGMSHDDGNCTGSTSNNQDFGLAADAGSYSSSDQNKSNGRYIAYAGGGGAHNHGTMNFAVRYLDVIIASKD